MAADTPAGCNPSLISVFLNAREEPGVMSDDRIRMFLQMGDPPPDGPDDEALAH
jgi:hypothetical protein